MVPQTVKHISIFIYWWTSLFADQQFLPELPLPQDDCRFCFDSTKGAVSAVEARETEFCKAHKVPNLCACGT